MCFNVFVRSFRAAETEQPPWYARRGGGGDGGATRRKQTVNEQASALDCPLPIAQRKCVLCLCVCACANKASSGAAKLCLRAGVENKFPVVSLLVYVCLCVCVCLLEKALTLGRRSAAKPASHVSRMCLIGDLIGER